MKLHSAVLFVNDIEKSKRFYLEVLNQEIEHDFGANIIFRGGLAIWQIFEEHEIVEKLVTSGVSNKFELYFEHDDIQGIFSKLKSTGIKFFHEIIEEPWGQFTFRVFDPDNHLIEIGEKMESFVKRMNNCGLSIEQISLKTHIPFDTVKKIII